MTTLALPRRPSEEAVAHWRSHRRETARVAFSPRSTLSLSTWADSKRYLSADLGEPGRWHTSRVPYMRDIMDAVTDPRVREVTIMKPTRIGATQSVILNAIGYYVDQEPSPIIVALPTTDDAIKFSTQLLQPMLDDTPCLAGKLDAVKSKKRRSTMLQKAFPGGTVQIIGTKSPRTMRMVHGRIILMSEIDSYERMAGQDGDPAALLPKRADGYANPKFVRESSPLLEETSRIKPFFEAGSQEHYHFPCPHCGELQLLVFGGRDVDHGIKWESGRPETAHYVCVSGCVIEEKLKYRMLSREAGARWIATHPERTEHRSFHLTSFVSAFPGARWSLLVEEWLRTKIKPELRRIFVNTVLGETYREVGTKVEAHVLEDRRETYRAEVPAGVGKLVRTVDVQGNRLETLVVGFGDGEEVYPVEHEIIEGDPGIPEGRPGSPWTELAAQMEARRYTHESGELLAPAIAGIDLGGHHTKEVYAFCRKHRTLKIYPLQGSKMGQGVPLVSKQKYSDTGKTTFYSIGVFTAKELILARLGKVVDVGAGYIHIPDWMSTEHLEQLTAEELTSSIKGGRLVRVFKKRRDRNEFLDLMAYAFGMLHALGPSAVKGLGAASRALIEKGEAARAKAEATPPADGDATEMPDGSAPKSDRRRGGGWMGGIGRPPQW